MNKINKLMAHFKTAQIVESENDTNVFVVKGKEYTVLNAKELETRELETFESCFYDEIVNSAKELYIESFSVIAPYAKADNSKDFIKSSKEGYLIPKHYVELANSFFDAAFNDVKTTFERMSWLEKQKSTYIKVDDLFLEVL